MNPARCDELDYIDFLVAAQKAFTCTEAARVQPAAAGAAAGDAPAHDSFNRLLERLPQDTEALWEESRRLVNLREGVLILDDTTLDKPYAEKMDYVTYHWSGKHHDVVKGINLITNAALVRRKGARAHGLQAVQRFGRRPDQERSFYRDAEGGKGQGVRVVVRPF